MSHRGSSSESRVFIGNLPPDVRSKDIEDIFYKFGKILFIDLKNRRGSPFCFVEFDDARWVLIEFWMDKISVFFVSKWIKNFFCRPGTPKTLYMLGTGTILTDIVCVLNFPGVESGVQAVPFYLLEVDQVQDFVDHPPDALNTVSLSQVRGKALKMRWRKEFKICFFTFLGLPPSGSWQDLKDHMREAGDVCYADVHRDGTGVVEYLRYEDMKYAIKKLDDSRFRSHEVTFLMHFCLAF